MKILLVLLALATLPACSSMALKDQEIQYLRRDNARLQSMLEIAGTAAHKPSQPVCPDIEFNGAHCYFSSDKRSQENCEIAIKHAQDDFNKACGK
jgi:hypothetical protein